MVKSIIKYIIILFLLTGCQSVIVYTRHQTPEVRRETTETRHQSPEVREQRTPDARRQSQDARGQRVEYMVASWYGNQFHGRQTASGETFNMYEYTAAHRTLPFGTRLRLTNETNNKEAVVRVNDRGPVPLERDLDVSFRAAQTLDFVNTGTIRLRVVILD